MPHWYSREKKDIMKARSVKRREIVYSNTPFVINFIFGGAKGYSAGMLMSTLKTPPSYTVLSGPAMVPVKCVEFDSSTSMLTPLEVSLRNSCIKMAPTKRVLLARVLYLVEEQ